MKERIITALVMIAAVASIIFIFPMLFALFIMVLLGIAICEWCHIAKIPTPKSYWVAVATIFLWLIAITCPPVLTIMLVVTVLHYIYALRFLWQYEKITNFRIHRDYLTFFAPIILATLAASLSGIFYQPSAVGSLDNALSLTYIIMVIAAADSGAYFSGYFLGKHKLSPKVSPKKTIEGLFGGMLSVIMVSWVFGFMVESWHLSIAQLAFISIAAALFSVIGDLFISVVKRQNNIKDTSQILPGHGGILDRIDGLLAGVPVFYLLQQIV